MSTKRKKLLTALFLVFAAAMLTFAGCKVGPSTAQDILDENELTAKVVYYANDGKFNNEENIRNVYFKADTPALNIVQEGYFPADTSSNRYPKNIFVSNSGFVLAGWEYVELDENENPVFIDNDGTTLRMHVFSDDERDTEIPVDEYGNSLTAFDNEKGELVFRSEKTITAKSSGTPVDFTKKIPDGGKWYFVAKWVSDVRLNYVLVCDEEVMIDGVAYSDGDIIYKASYGRGSSINVASYAPATDDSTFLQAFAEAECETEVTSMQKPTDGNDAQIFVKYIAGKWDVVKTPLDVSTMFTNLGMENKKFYLLNDIDCSNIRISPNLGDLKCTISGNGCTIVNLNVSASNLGQDTNASLFGNITAGADIKDLKFENLNVSLEARNNVTVRLFMLCAGVAEGAQISGLSLKNSTFTFGDARRTVGGVSTPQTTVTNLPYAAGVYGTDNWMFGGLETDSAFINKYDVKINGYTLKVITNSITKDTETLVTVEPLQ